MPAPQAAPAGSLDRAIDRVNRWFASTYWQRVVSGGEPEYSEDREPGSLQDLQRELQDLRCDLRGLARLPARLDRFAALGGYQDDLDGIRAWLSAIAVAADRLTTLAQDP